MVPAAPERAETAIVVQAATYPGVARAVAAARAETVPGAVKLLEGAPGSPWHEGLDVRVYVAEREGPQGPSGAAAVDVGPVQGVAERRTATVELKEGVAVGGTGPLPSSARVATGSAVAPSGDPIAFAVHLGPRPVAARPVQVASLAIKTVAAPREGREARAMVGTSAPLAIRLTAPVAGGAAGTGAPAAVRAMVAEAVVRAGDAAVGAPGGGRPIDRLPEGAKVASAVGANRPSRVSAPAAMAVGVAGA